jgi:hypothetical protein
MLPPTEQPRHAEPVAPPAARPGRGARWLPLAALLLIGVGLAALYGPWSPLMQNAGENAGDTPTREYRTLPGAVAAGRPASPAADAHTPHVARLATAPATTRPTEHGPAVAELHRRIQQLRTDAREAQTARRQAEARADKLNRELARLRAELAGYKKDLDEAVAQLDPARIDAAHARAALREKTDEAEKLANRLTQAKRAAAAAAKQHAEREAELQKLVDAAAAEIVAAERRRAEAARQPDPFIPTMQRLYLSATAPMKTGIAARQAAAKQRQLLRRVDQLRKQVHSRKTRTAMDTAEIVLTSLDLLRPDRPDAVHAFIGRVRRLDVPDKLAEVLQAEREPTAVRDWLLEARLVLEALTP